MEYLLRVVARVERRWVVELHVRLHTSELNNEDAKNPHKKGNHHDRRVGTLTVH